MEVKEKNRRYFRIALASARMSEAEFARKAKVSPQAIDQVFKDITRSERLSNEIERFIIREFKKLCVVLDDWQEMRRAASPALSNVNAVAELLQQENQHAS